MSILDNLFDNGCTLLMKVIVECNRVDNYAELITEYVETYQSEINIQDHQGLTALMYSVKYPSISKILINAGADLLIKNNRGENFFNMIILKCEKYSSHPTFNYLIDVLPLKFFSEVDKKIIRRATKDNLKNAVLLVSNNKLPQRPITFSLTFAINLVKYDKKLIKLIDNYIKWHPAKIDVCNPQYYNKTPFQSACDNYNDSKLNKLNNLRIIKILINYGSNINVKSVNGENELVRASYANSYKLVRLLIRSGIDLDVQDFKHNTALTYNITNNNLRTVEKLINAGANVNLINNDGRNILMTSLLISERLNILTEIIKKIIYATTDLNILDVNNYTALDMLVKSNNLKNVCDHEIFYLLIERGAELNLYKTDKIIKNIVDSYRDKLKYLNQIQKLTDQIKLLEFEIKLHPDSEFVTRLAEHFDSLK